jgi:hypothetical protein
VRYFREIGVWNDEREAHNQRLLERQRVLAVTWARLVDAPFDSDEAFVDAWLAARVTALRAAGFDPVWIDPRS